ncbi:unnamed protein product [Discula destructiva]
MDRSDSEIQLRAKLAGNSHLVELLLKHAPEDRRVKRMVELLTEVSHRGLAMSSCVQEIMQICAENPKRRFGFHPRLRLLIEDMSKSCDFLLEFSNRVMMYLDHLGATGSLMPESVRLLVKSALHEQMDLSTTFCREARSAYANATCSAPGPAPMPDESTTNRRLDAVRGLFNGEPKPIGKDYDSRWDPDYRVPGSPHCKFFKFPGNYFAPDTNPAKFDHFLLSQTTAALIEDTNRKFADAREKHESKKDAANLDYGMPDAAQAEDPFDAFAKEHKYDLDAIVLHTRTRPRDITATAGPYMTNGQVTKSRVDDGYWAPEDLNRQIEIHERGRQVAVIPAVDVGCQVIFDQRISRAKKD